MSAAPVLYGELSIALLGVRTWPARLWIATRAERFHHRDTIMTKRTLHTHYDAVNVDNRFWVCSSDPGESNKIPVGSIGEFKYTAGSIRNAKKKAAKILGCLPEEIETASYLSHWEKPKDRATCL